MPLARLRGGGSDDAGPPAGGPSGGLSLVSSPSFQTLARLASRVKCNSLFVDAATASGLYALGKFTSSFINGQAQDVRWLINWAAIGIVDGALTSSWYALIQTLANGSSYGPVSKTLLMMMASSFLYTPVYCAYFLVLISLLEGQSWAGAMERVRADALAMLLNATKVCGAAALALARCRPPCGKQSGKPLTRQ